MKKDKEEKPKTYNIKMPVYTTSQIEQVDGLFDRVSNRDLVNLIKKSIDGAVLPINCVNKNKTKITVINKIDYEEVNIGDVPSLLVQISAFNTNFYDGYFEGDEKIEIKKNNKVGSDSNFVLLYPRIVGLTNESYTCYFLMLVYEDPTKDNGEVCRLAKLVANKILNYPVQNIKVPMILEELKGIGVIPELQIQYYSLTESENNVDVKYASYLDKMCLRKEESRLFKNMPFQTMEELLTDKSEDGNYQKKRTKIFWGKKEYRISKELINEVGEELKETGEKIFNAATAISQLELDSKVHDKDFMIEKMSAVITNYISYGD